MIAELDVDEVGPSSLGAAPPGAKGIELLAVGAKLGRSLRVLREVVGVVRDWMTRTGTRGVRMTIDGDVLEIAGASDTEVRALVDAFIQRHSED